MPREIGVYRGEAAEALRQLTGRNYGFDVEKWRTWLAQNQAAYAPREQVLLEKELAFKPLP